CAIRNDVSFRTGMSITRAKREGSPYPQFSSLVATLPCITCRWTPYPCALRRRKSSAFSEVPGQRDPPAGDFTSRRLPVFLAPLGTSFDSASPLAANIEYHMPHKELFSKA